MRSSSAQRISTSQYSVSVCAWSTPPRAPEPQAGQAGGLRLCLHPWLDSMSPPTPQKQTEQVLNLALRRSVQPRFAQVEKSATPVQPPQFSHQSTAQAPHTVRGSGGATQCSSSPEDRGKRVGTTCGHRIHTCQDKPGFAQHLSSRCFTATHYQH